MAQKLTYKQRWLLKNDSVNHYMDEQTLEDNEEATFEQTEVIEEKLRAQYNCIADRFRNLPVN